MDEKAVYHNAFGKVNLHIRIVGCRYTWLMMHKQYKHAQTDAILAVVRRTMVASIRLVKLL